MKKILVITTGGTIGSETDGNIKNVSQNKAFIKTELIDKYREKYGGGNEFDVISPLNILSENMSMTDIAKLLGCVYGADDKKYKGIIITHGSDTLAYTSALAGFAFSRSLIPIVLTAANHPVSHPDSNAADNFHSAVCVIDSGVLNGVFTVYQNSGGENCVYLATRITPADPFTDEFGCFGNDIFAKVSGDELIFNITTRNPDISQLKTLPVKAPVLRPKNNIVKITPYPGIDYSAILLKKGTKAVLHTLYHSSTAPVENSGLCEFITRCKAESVDFYILPVKDTEAVYESTSRLLSLGAIPLNNISESAAYSKLCAAYGQAEEDPKEFMKKNIFFEYII